MASAAVEKTAEELRKEIEELNRQQWEITERLRDPRGIRRGGLVGNNARIVGPAGGRGLGRGRGIVRTDKPEIEEPPAKRRLSSAVVKVEDGEIVEEMKKEETKEQDKGADKKPDDSEVNGKRSNLQRNQIGLRRERGNWMDQEGQPVENVPRVLPKDEDPSLVKRNRRMLGQLLGTLEKFREEDKQLSSSEAYMRRSDSLRRAEQRAREESDRLRQQEREQLAEKRRRDLTLRARLAAKAEEKKLDLLFLQWTEQHKKLCNFLRTKAEPPIYYVPAKPSENCTKLLEEQQKEFSDWKANRRQELTEYQKQISEQLLANVEVELQRWQNAGNTRNGNTAASLQESMDNDLESHKLSHGPKTRLPRGGEDVEEDVEDVGEDDIMDDVLEDEENVPRRDDDTGTGKGIVNYGGGED
uniref:Pinin/SDK/MemA protein domain-containing protein n=2 Tax=Araucaria cunninghamii TaxID=56994 RepID=A0A0D6QYP3_ARACU